MRTRVEYKGVSAKFPGERKAAGGYPAAWIASPAQALSPPASALPGVLVAFVVGAGVLFLVFVPVAEAALVAAVGVFVAPTGVRVEGFTRVPVAAGGVGAIARAPVAGYVAASEAVVVPIPVTVVVAVPV